MKPKRFVTLFQDLENIHLIKDVGQIPEMLAKKYGIESEIVGLKKSIDYSFSSEIPHCKLTTLEQKSESHYWQKELLSYVYDNARNIDILNLYHYSPQTFLLGILYKLRNPKGTLYLKLDNDLRSLEEKGELYNYGSFLGKLRFSLLEFFFRKLLTIASIETTRGLTLVQHYYKDIATKVFLLPNGISLPDEILSMVNHPPQKENIVLSVGRLGTLQKNTSRFLDAIKLLPKNVWKFIFVGPIEDSFKAELSKFYTERPDLKDSVIFTGPIENRKEIFTYFLKAKVFCLPSLWESFGLVTIEAMVSGCYVITSEYSSTADILPQESMRTLVNPEKIEELTSALKNVVTNDVPKTFQSSESRAFVLNNFIWDRITEKLGDKLLLAKNG